MFLFKVEHLRQLKVVKLPIFINVLKKCQLLNTTPLITDLRKNICKNAQMDRKQTFCPFLTIGTIKIHILPDNNDNTDYRHHLEQTNEANNFNITAENIDDNQKKAHQYHKTE